MRNYKFVFSLWLTGSIILLGLIGTDQEDSSSLYITAVLGYADTMIETGGDHYGDIHSPLFAITLDRETLKLPEGDRLIEIEKLDYEDWGVRRYDRILDGANPMRHQNLYQILYALTDVTGDSIYSKRADDALKWFFQNTQSKVTGLLPWGEHAGWSFYDNNLSGRDIHEFTRTWILWERTFELVPEQSERFAQGLWHHQIGNQESGAFSRHAKYSDHEPGTGWGFPNHGGYFINTWTNAYAHTGDKMYLQAIETLLKLYENNASKKTGAIPAEINNSRSNNLMLWPQSNVSLAIDLERSANSDHLPKELTNRMREMAKQIDDVYYRLPHKVHKDGGFVQRSHVHTLEAITLLDEHEHAYTDQWGGAYGHRATVKVANKILVRYRQTRSEEYLRLMLNAASQYLDSDPDANQVIYPGTLGEAIFLMLGAYEATGEVRFLERADHFGRLALDMFFDDYSPLPRATSLHDHYEANDNLPDTLMMALLSLWEALNPREVKLDLVWID